MAAIEEITIRNFKGINEVTLKLIHKGAPPVTTLIGLNESGKTTILEALSHFITGDSTVSSLFEGIHSKSEVAALIPVNKKANFTGKISISAKIALDEKDHHIIKSEGDKLGYTVDGDSLPSHIEARRDYLYENSEYKKRSNSWEGLNLMVKRGRAKNFKQYARPDDTEEDDLWLNCILHIQETLPSIAYFPTFLVDMPKKIYLSSHINETPQNKYYRLVFQDILNNLNEGLTLQKHVVSRIESFKEKESNPNWFSLFWGSPSKTPIDSVFTKISSTVTREVLGSWQKVFKRKISAKNVLVEWGIDTDKDDLPYATFAISDGESRYFISERSLGFRWFFSFLLFTAFKQERKRPTLFLFDEPAANLHAKAQQELLKSFSRTVANGDIIIYSTHSHHMINPQWIAGAQIVENTALDYDSDEDTFGINTKPTNVILTSYRHFVAQNPSRTSYFQPVIDTLEYVTPEIVGSGPFVLLEGITDFYALKVAEKLSGISLAFSFMPGVGSGAADPQIGLLLGRGERFVVLLDDDAAGRSNADRYREKWFMDDKKVFTLGEIKPEFKSKRLEELITEETRVMIKNHAGLDKHPNKKQIGMYLAEMAGSNPNHDCIDKNTLSNLLEIINYAKSSLKMN